MRMLTSAAAALALSLGVPASAAVSVTGATFTYAQNFDTLSAVFGHQAWANDSTLAGWSLFISTLAPAPTYRPEIGNQDIGSFTAYGHQDSGDRALGAIGDGNAYFGSPAPGAVAGYIAVAFTNDTGLTLNSFSLGFSGEEWRYSGAPAQTMVLEYGFGVSFAAVSHWSAPGGSFDWTSPLFGGGGLGGIDGNGLGRVIGRGGVLPVNWAAGDTLWVRWTVRNQAGQDHGLGLDDLSFSVTAVPEPASGALLLAGLVSLAHIARRRGHSSAL